MDFVIFLEQKITISMDNALFIGIWVEIENVCYDSESRVRTFSDKSDILLGKNTREIYLKISRIWGKFCFPGISSPRYVLSLIKTFAVLNYIYT